jgi:hypothetical protein
MIKKISILYVVGSLSRKNMIDLIFGVEFFACCGEK